MKQVLPILLFVLQWILNPFKVYRILDPYVKWVWSQPPASRIVCIIMCIELTMHLAYMVQLLLKMCSTCIIFTFVYLFIRKCELYFKK